MRRGTASSFSHRQTSGSQFTYNACYSELVTPVAFASMPTSGKPPNANGLKYPPTLSDVTVVALAPTLYSPHEWRPPGAPEVMSTPSLSTFAVAMSRCEEKPK